MNTISSAVQNLAMEGQALYVSSYKRGTPSSTAQMPAIQTGAEVAQNIEQNLAETKATSQELQKLSELTAGRTLKFSVNKELGSVVVAIVDSTTDKVLKEIPSEDMQRLKIRLRKAIGSLYNNLV
mgnify:CR=1 FL=1